MIDVQHSICGNVKHLGPFASAATRDICDMATTPRLYESRLLAVSVRRGCEAHLGSLWYPERSLQLNIECLICIRCSVYLWRLSSAGERCSEFACVLKHRVLII